jgi:hypothetical protein
MMYVKHIWFSRIFTLLVLVLIIGLSSCAKTELEDVDVKHEQSLLKSGALIDFEDGSNDSGNDSGKEIGDNGGDEDQDKDEAIGDNGGDDDQDKDDVIGDNGGDDDQDKDDKAAMKLF